MKLRKCLEISMAVMVVLLMTNCKNGKETAQTTEVKSDPIAANVAAAVVFPEVLVQSGFVKPKENGRFHFQKISLSDSLLTMVVNYSGGCKAHQFDLISSGFYAKSYPPQLTLFLQHADSADACRELVIDTLRFDVSNIKYPGAKEVILRFNNSKETLRYQYN
jgi:hypothetical protein